MLEPDKILSAVGTVLSGYVAYRTLKNGQKTREETREKEMEATRIAEVDRAEKADDKRYEALRGDAAYWVEQVTLARAEADRQAAKHNAAQIELERRDNYWATKQTNIEEVMVLVSVPGAMEMLRAHQASYLKSQTI